MNEIGIKYNTNKENKTTHDIAIDGPPEWINAAHVYLRLLNLGDEWGLCVEVWVKLEEQLEYGVLGKVTVILPC